MNTLIRKFSHLCIVLIAIMILCMTSLDNITSFLMKKYNDLQVMLNLLEDKCKGWQTD